ncbi:MAG: PEGA domain-containing protein [Acidobacteria bacterium]|nr:PEGA domain-containing protein [Acidobacteriota bacterium]
MTREGSLFDVPPAAIGRFRVLHQVGAGTSGPVFRATDPEFDRAVAIKLFSLNLTRDRAADVAIRLEHLVADAPPLAAAVSPLAAGMHEHTPYLVTSFAPGDSLDVALRQYGPAALEDLVPRLRALAVAIDAAAARGVLHGALHPRDVIVSEHDTAVTGLGVWPLLVEAGARLPARRPYRAPELTDASVSASGDRFAFAALAYEWMTGRRAPALFGQSDMAPLPGADRDRMAQVFAHALSAGPDERGSTCAELVSAIADVAADAEVPAPLTGRRPRRRPRAPAPTPALEEFPSGPDAGTLPLEPADEDEPAPGELTHREPGTFHAGSGAAEAHHALGEPWAEDDARSHTAPPAPLPAADEPSVPADGDLAMRPLTPPTLVHVGPPPAAGPGTMSLAAALIGLALGVLTGYVVWGRARPVAPVSATAPAAPAPSPAVPGPGEAPPGVAAPDTVPPQAGTRAPEPRGRAPAASTNVPAVTAPAAAPVASPAGRLLIRSAPGGATVFVDDERRGVTPAALRDLALGTRRVRVQRDGYVAEVLQVTLTRDRPSRSVEVRLRRAPVAAAETPTPAAAKTGTLLVESRPSGATALVNGRPVGTTPVTLADLAPGTYTVQLRLAGFRPFTTTVRVVAGAQVRAAGSLTSAQEPK